MQIRIFLEYGEKVLPCTLDMTETVSVLKTKARELFRLQDEHLYITNLGKILRDEHKTIAETGIIEGSTVTLRRMCAGADELGGTRYTETLNQRLKDILCESMEENPEHLKKQQRDVDFALRQLHRHSEGNNYRRKILKDLESYESVFRSFGPRFGIRTGPVGAVLNTPLPGPVRNKNPFVVYRREIQQLVRLGFGNTEACVRALAAAGGNIDSAIVILGETDAPAGTGMYSETHN